MHFLIYFNNCKLCEYAQGIARTALANCTISNYIMNVIIICVTNVIIDLSYKYDCIISFYLI